MLQTRRRQLIRKMTVFTYTVQRGESARSVAWKFMVSQAALTRENETPFYEGQKVTVPVCILTLPPSAGQNRADYYQVPPSAIVSRPGTENIIF